MKTLKLLLGITSICMACYCAYLARSDEIQNYMMTGEGVGITAGIVLCAVMLAAGIIAVAGRAGRKGTNFAGVLYLAVFVAGVLLHGQTTWMLVCAFTSFVCAAVFLGYGVWMGEIRQPV